jgi:hypothetical protein
MIIEINQAIVVGRYQGISAGLPVEFLDPFDNLYKSPAQSFAEDYGGWLLASLGFTEGQG